MRSLGDTYQRTRNGANARNERLAPCLKRMLRETYKDEIDDIMEMATVGKILEVLVAKGIED